MLGYFSPLLLVGGIIITVAIYYRQRSKPALPDLPWLNTRDGELFTRLRARFRSTIDYKDAIYQAYEQYSKNDQSCILPDINGAEIILPISAMSWFISQSDTVLSVDEMHRDTLQFDHTFVHPFIVENPLHHETVRTDLTRQLGSLTGPIMDELSASFDEYWGTDTENWRELCVFDSAMQIVARTSNRALIGLPWCRNQTLLDHAKGFATAIAVSAALLKQMPALLRPILSPLVTLPNKRHTRGFARILRPEIERRQRLLDQTTDNEKMIGEKEPNDFLQWCIRRARESGITVENDPDIIAERTLAVNFAAIHTSTMSITNAVFDLVASDPSLRYLEILRNEAASVVASDNGIWTKQGIARMLKIDSALRESSRMGSFVGALARVVVSPNGTTAPNGTFCPYGSMISVPTTPVQNDPTLYPSPGTYQPFRFSSQREAHHLEGNDSQDEGKVTNTEEYIKKANLSFVSTSASYHPFGHGRHACPGRFFAANELKMLLAYMVLNYDFEMQPSRPNNVWMGRTHLPPMKATIKVRRRAL
ncbi:hypothetical protein LTS15_006296 [Exophiala xenobiotica]|nr:hypothetical protein LTS15_006296 [Exophiala xenobiotica]